MNQARVNRPPGHTSSRENPMFTFTKTFRRVALASLAGCAIAVAGVSGAAQAKDLRHGLPNNLKAGIENLSKADLNKVRIHRATNAPAKAGANAFAQGGKIHLAPGQAKHLPHETWHAVQQKNGRIPSKAIGNAGNVSDAGKAAKSASFAKRAKSARTIAKTHQAAKVARHANTLRKGVKAANTARNIARVATAGTGVGAVVGITAGLAGVDPIEMATLKATNPAEYNRRMNALKKNPAKYMGDNIKNNTVKTVNDVKKAGAAVGKATQTASKAVGTAANKAGCGIGNVFKKKGNKAKC